MGSDESSRALKLNAMLVAQPSRRTVGALEADEDGTSAGTTEGAGEG
ncbi:hypothetical protein ACFZAV_16685 [Streptomyces sp. NPDC008343]